LSGRYEKLAFHAEGAGDYMRSLEYLWEAGLEARNNSAAASLSLIFDRATELIGKIGTPAEERFVDFVLMAHASLLQLGEFAKMNAYLPRATELARTQGRAEKICAALSQTAMVCWFEGRYGEARQLSAEALDMAYALNSQPLIFAAHFVLANTMHDMGDVGSAIAIQRKLCENLMGELESARLGATGMPALIARSFLAWYLLDVGQYDEAHRLASAALDVAARAQDPYSEVLARSALSKALLMKHQYEECVDCLRLAGELADANGYDAIKPNLAGRIALALSRTGGAMEGVSIVEACLKNGFHLRSGRVEVCYLYSGYAAALAAMGRRDAAFEALDTALTIGRAIANPRVIIDALGQRSQLLTELDRADPRIAQDLAEQAALCRQFGIVAWDGFS
jgi:tetratricopeptide (TPR) repeat protein